MVNVENVPKTVVLDDNVSWLVLDMEQIHIFMELKEMILIVYTFGMVCVNGMIMKDVLLQILTTNSGLIREY